jgi:glycosyltransferase involved in cell wall biosynthesis
VIKTVIVSNEIVGPTTNGGIGSFALHFARLLKRNTDNSVTLIYSGELGAPRRQWIALYKQDDIEVIEAPPQRSSGSYTLGYDWFIKTSEAAAAAIPPDTDIVYFHENNANGFYAIRARQFSQVKYPVHVTIMHSSSDWILEAMEQFPNQLAALSGNFAERYQTRNSDFIVSLTHYLAQWCQDNGWNLPPDRMRILGGPFLPLMRLLPPNTSADQHFSRLIFFGRLERRKGFELFIETLLMLRRRSLQTASHPFSQIKEIVLLGREGYHRFGTLAKAIAVLEECGVQVTVLNQLNTVQAQSYLAQHVADALVVMPSLIDNHPYAVLEATLIPGLNLICSNVGGAPEILGAKGADQLFAPYPDALLEKLESWLEHGPKPDSDLAKYDWQRANQNWLTFHAEATQYAKDIRSKKTVFPVPAPASTIDVCIPINEHLTYLAPLLESLKQQTKQTFNIFVLNNIPDSPNEQAIFEEIAQRYPADTWHFNTVTERVSPKEAMKRVAQQGQADYILFLESSDIAAPHLIERFSEGVQVSGCDYLGSYQYTFEGESHYLPIQTLSMKLLREARYIYLPLGNALEISLLWNCFGPSTNCIVRRSAFEAIQGHFPTGKPYSNVSMNNSYILPLSLSLAGYKIDVLPEFLIYHRFLTNSTDPFTLSFAAQHDAQTLLRAYLQPTGLEDLAFTAYGWVARSNIASSGGSLPSHAVQALLHNPQWLAEHVPYRIIFQGLVAKLREKLKPTRIFSKT